MWLSIDLGLRIHFSEWVICRVELELEINGAIPASYPASLDCGLVLYLPGEDVNYSGDAYKINKTLVEFFHMF